MVTQESFGPFTRWRVSDPRSGAFFTLIPERGGMIQHLVVPKNGHLFSILKCADTPEALLNDAGYANALMFPFASRIRDGRYTFLGETYQLPVNNPAQQCAIHGLVSKRPFRVVHSESGDDASSITVGYDYPGDYPGYPFPFSIEVRYTLAADGSFTLAFTARNTGDKPLPAGFGWHSYFQIEGEVADDWTVESQLVRQFVLDERILITGSEPARPLGPLRGAVLDNIFETAPGNGSCRTTLRSLLSGLHIHVDQETGPGKFNYLVLYTPAARNCVALEPLTNNIDAFNTGEGLVTVAPGGVFSGSFTIS